MRIAAAQTEREQEKGERHTDKRGRLEGNDAALNKKIGELRDLQSLITIMQTTSTHRN